MKDERPGVLQTWFGGLPAGSRRTHLRMAAYCHAFNVAPPDDPDESDDPQS